MNTTEKHYDTIVLGSGTSGGVAAYRLQEAGARCLLIESGAHFTRADFPKPEIEYTTQLYWGGGLEYNTGCNLAFLRGRCVGGGSVVNAALLDRFDEIALNDWRDGSGVDFFTEPALDPHYTRAEELIALEQIPDNHRNANARLFIDAMDQCGYAWSPLRRCQSDCAIEEGNDCIACLGGCHRGSKQSTLETYVQWALDLGLELEANTHVTGIVHRTDGVTVYARQNGTERRYDAAKAVLAMGSFGTAQLLLNSGFGKALPALGKAFTMHPQFMNFAIFDEPVDAHKGVLQAVKSLDPGFRQRGFKLENVFAPPISIAVLSGKTGRNLQEFMGNYRNFGCIEVAVRDEAVGVLRTDRKGKLHIEKTLTDQDRKRAADGRNTVHAMFERLQAKEIVSCPLGFGLHLMGGCAIGAGGAHAVVNPEFQLHGYPNIYCADSSIFPNAPGINPALTIMALSHKMAEALANGKGA